MSAAVSEEISSFKKALIWFAGGGILLKLRTGA